MDQRSRLSRELIQDTFFELLKEKTVEKITVTEICKKASVNRTTFYKHYQDVWDLLNQIENDLAEGMSEWLRGYRHPDSIEVIGQVLRFIRQNGDRYLLLASEHGDREYINGILARWYQENPEVVDNVLTGRSPTEKQYLYRYITNGATAIVVEWLSGGMQEPEKDIAMLIYRLNKAVIQSR